MKNCESIKELIEERKEIELRLHNTQMIIEILSDYRVIYDQLINVEQQLHNNNIEEAVSINNSTSKVFYYQNIGQINNNSTDITEMEDDKDE